MEEITTTDQTISTQMTPIAEQVSAYIAPLFIVSIVLTILLGVSVVSSALRKRKLYKAVLAMQSDLHEINEREKKRLAYGAPQQPVVIKEDQLP